MRGTYCLVLSVPKKVRVRVGSLGMKDFEPGMYVYVGSALSGMEARIGRHKSSSKKKRWHIDYLLSRGEVVSVIAIPTADKSIECSIACSLMDCEDAVIPIRGFGSSDCSCGSHLLYFGDSDPEWIAEEIAMRISLFPGMYQKECPAR